MDRDGTWGNNEEVMAFIHLLKTSVISYIPSGNHWIEHTPQTVDPTLPDSSDKYAYLEHASQHFNVITSTMPMPTSGM